MNQTMGDIFRRVSAFMSGRNGTRVRAVVGMVMLAAQLMLLSHQFQHHLRLDFDRADDCVQCQFAATMDAAPASTTVALPNEVVIFRQSALPAEQTLHRYRPAANFNSRAPPISVPV